MFWTNERKNRRNNGYVFTISKEERKDRLNNSINRRLSKRFDKCNLGDKVYLTTLFL